MYISRGAFIVSSHLLISRRFVVRRKYAIFNSFKFVVKIDFLCFRSKKDIIRLVRTY